MSRMTLMQTPALRQLIECSMCKQYILPDDVKEVAVSKAIFGSKAYAVCPNCGQEAPDPDSQEWRAKVDWRLVQAYLKATGRTLESLTGPYPYRVSESHPSVSGNSVRIVSIRFASKTRLIGWAMEQAGETTQGEEDAGESS